MIAQNRGEAAEWERKAVLAVKSGNDPLAKGSLRQLQQKIEDAARKRNQQTMTSLSDSSAFQVFDRIEAEADASGDKLL